LPQRRPDVGEPRSRRPVGLADLASLLRRSGAGPAPQPEPPTLCVTASAAAEAGGPDLIERTVAAVAGPRDPAIEAKARAVIAALRSIKPVGAIENGLAGLFVAVERMAFDSMQVARVAGLDSPTGMIMLARAEKLACRAAELADAISRQRNRGKRQVIRIERVNIETGAQAVVGVVEGRRGQQ
jgi:hypothetical protein